jgi:hypothetical protein
VVVLLDPNRDSSASLLPGDEVLELAELELDGGVPALVIALSRAEPALPGPKPDGQVRDIIEVLLGTGMRTGEVLALRPCDLEDSARGMVARVTGMVVQPKGHGAIRQPPPEDRPPTRTGTSAPPRPDTGVCVTSAPEGFLRSDVKVAPLPPVGLRARRWAGRDGLLTPVALPSSVLHRWRDDCVRGPLLEGRRTGAGRCTISERHWPFLWEAAHSVTGSRLIAVLRHVERISYSAPRTCPGRHPVRRGHRRSGGCRCGG